MLNRRIVWYSKINFEEYNLPPDGISGDWNSLFNDLKSAYAEYFHWDEEYCWDEDDDKLYDAELAAYSIINELKEKIKEESNV